MESEFSLWKFNFCEHSFQSMELLRPFEVVSRYGVINFMLGA